MAEKAELTPPPSVDPGVNVYAQRRQLGLGLGGHRPALFFVAVPDRDGDHLDAVRRKDRVRLAQCPPCDDATTTCLMPRARARSLAIASVASVLCSPPVSKSRVFSSMMTSNQSATL